ncbi:MAG: hypothetical protein DRQ55_06160 [Planctomycetota bacterium]|nr:MAG: hypothetical protein DRQ55_06160 [Planctomycetota bacterium]
MLAGLMRRRSWTQSVQREALEQAWTRAAGERVATRSRVAHLRDQTLTIELSSAAQRYELEAFHAGSILTRLQADEDAPPVRRLAFRLGHGNPS